MSRRKKDESGPEEKSDFEKKEVARPERV